MQILISVHLHLNQWNVDGSKIKKLKRQELSWHAQQEKLKEPEKQPEPKPEPPKEEPRAAKVAKNGAQTTPIPSRARALRKKPSGWVISAVRSTRVCLRLMLVGGVSIWVNPILGALTLTIIVAATFDVHLRAAATRRSAAV